MGDKININRVIEILEGYSEHGATLTELIEISGISYSNVINAFEELEDLGKLDVRSDGLSRIYRIRK